MSKDVLIEVAPTAAHMAAAYADHTTIEQDNRDYSHLVQALRSKFVIEEAPTAAKKSATSAVQTTIEQDNRHYNHSIQALVFKYILIEVVPTAAKKVRGVCGPHFY